MSLRHKVTGLRNNIELLRRRCEQRLLQLSRENQSLAEAEDAFSAQIQGLSDLLISSQVNNSIMSSEQLKTLLRKQALLRSNIQDLHIQIVQLKTEREALIKHYSEQQQKKAFFLRKEEAYNRWLFLEKKKVQRCTLFRDEIEQEESCYGKYFTGQ
ncbi:TPA: hypothetical protein ACIBKF_003451 [Salmonella enterica subsp. enterica serovar 6,7:y:-]